MNMHDLPNSIGFNKDPALVMRAVLHGANLSLRKKIGDKVTRTNSGKPKTASMSQAKTGLTNRLVIPVANKVSTAQITIPICMVNNKTGARLISAGITVIAQPIRTPSSISQVTIARSKQVFSR